MTPGNKNGWSQEQGGWVVNSVGFAGPTQRYTLAIMNGLNGQGVMTKASQPPPGSARSCSADNRAARALYSASA